MRLSRLEENPVDNPIKIDKKDHVLEVTIDRPKANAIDLATSRVMGKVFRDFRDDPDLRVAILTAAGEKFFSAGWDLKAAADGDAVDGDYGVGGFGGLQELPHLNKPVICAVNGICCGGGLEIALSTDIILAAEHATFALPEIRSGTVADAASIKLPKRIPYHIAMEMLLTGELISSVKAAKIGLINEVMDDDSLHKHITEIALKISKKSAMTLKTGKEAFYKQIDMTLPEAYDFASRVMVENMLKLDANEGIDAFIEKRKPNWQDK